MADQGKPTSVLQLAVLVSGIGVVLLMVGGASIAHAIEGGRPAGAATVVVAVAMIAYAGRLFRGYRFLLRQYERRATLVLTDDALDRRRPPT